MFPVLVTGGAGFIGSHLADRLVELGYRVAILDNLSSGKLENVNPKAEFYEMDIRDVAIEQIFMRHRFQVVFHLAAQMSVAYSVRFPVEDADINVCGTLNILESCVKYEVRKIIFASSGGTVYGNAPSWPATEEMPLSGLSPYGISKIAIEYYLPYYQMQYGLRYTSLRYANVYGPRQDPHGEAGVVAIFTKKMLAAETPTINGDGLHSRDYVYVDDVVQANVLCIDKGDNQAFNVGTGITTTNRQLYDAIGEATGFKKNPIYGPERPGDLRTSSVSYQKIKDLVGWEPRVRLSEGIKKTAEYFRVPH